MSPPIQLHPSIPSCDPTSRCGLPPADPNGPGMQQNPNVDRGPNDFTLGIDGPDPVLEVGGTHHDQERQRDFVLALNSRAAVSYASRALPGDARVPSDGQVEGSP